MILLCTNKPMHNGLLSPICPNDLRFLSKKNNSQRSKMFDCGLTMAVKGNSR